jgi:hypothetical protein
MSLEKQPVSSSLVQNCPVGAPTLCLLPQIVDPGRTGSVSWNSVVAEKMGVVMLKKCISGSDRGRIASPMPFHAGRFSEQM